MKGHLDVLLVTANWKTAAGVYRRELETQKTKEHSWWDKGTDRLDTEDSKGQARGVQMTLGSPMHV